ncbi:MULTISPECIES: amidohydrolase [unclassified Idiomarina]|jgi:predicted TIM-barrel fold metal-dependent hydrolase|uniref:amidohydrolase family protein n=1 Tax=unclassified Idiomarina TaxID=2614829 RepID=UPI0008F7F7CB|nr:MULTISPECIES: amidohydrolase family protein [unclassified Idiomarina]MAD54113.1 2-pyrone-4,6-dicarboxylate hydrolase [Idiomarinaceae bacterium]MEC7642186.1 amidohydrolase family protein [Pseudomonadota bacterium]NQZ05253.1 amidohydrolase family protein [Idiomarina sp.]OIM98047.1 2-pyrone-4,6-dicarboxylate hydrolase [Idiomarina sp. MD25a]
MGINREHWPKRIIDSHLHIYDEAFPLIENQGHIPKPFYIDDYNRLVTGMPVEGGVIVSGSFQGFEQRYLKAALGNLGDNYVGITQLPGSVSDEKIQQLNEHRIRGVRVNLKRGVHRDIEGIVEFGRRIWDLAGWHLEIYVDSRELDDMVPTLLKLPKLSVDHLGMAKSGLSQVRRLAEGGVNIKASGFGRTEVNITEAIKTLYKTNPDCLMFGTDLPGTRSNRGFEPSDIDTIVEALDDSEATDKVFYQNAKEFYKLP